MSTKVDSASFCKFLRLQARICPRVRNHSKKAAEPLSACYVEVQMASKVISNLLGHTSIRMETRFLSIWAESEEARPSLSFAISPITS